MVPPTTPGATPDGKLAIHMAKAPRVAGPSKRRLPVTRFRFRRLRAIALALSAGVLAVAAPTALAGTSEDIRSPDARDAAAASQQQAQSSGDLRSPDARAAALGSQQTGPVAGRLSRPALAGRTGCRTRYRDGLSAGTRGCSGRDAHRDRGRGAWQPDARDRVLGQRTDTRAPGTRIHRPGAATAPPLDGALADQRLQPPSGRRSVGARWHIQRRYLSRAARTPGRASRELIPSFW